MSLLVARRERAAARLAENLKWSDELVQQAGHVAVAARFGPTNSGKGYHGPLAHQEIMRRIEQGEISDRLKELGIKTSVDVKSMVSRDMREEERNKPEQERTYSWYCDMKSGWQWRKFKGEFTAGNVCQAIVLHGKVYATRISDYQPGALCVAEYTGNTCRDLKCAGLFGDISATLLFGKTVDLWAEHTIKRDGPNPSDFSGRLDEGWEAIELVQEDFKREWPELDVWFGPNDYGRHRDVPAWRHLAAGALGDRDQQQIDLQGLNRIYFDRFAVQYGEFRNDYQANPRPLTEMFPALA